MLFLFKVGFSLTLAIHYPITQSESYSILVFNVPSFDFL